MIFKEDRLYHVYNKGDKGIKVFFSHDNYRYFLLKMQQHILPHADILAYCLMPNHYHIMIYVHSFEIEQIGKRNFLGLKNPEKTEYKYFVNLNKSIGVLQSSYTRAINREKGKSGSLFQKKAKAICLNENEKLQASYFNTNFGTVGYNSINFNNYPQVCFKYIHQNPVAAGLVKKPENWDYSSYQEFIEKNEQAIINLPRIKEFELI